jgi:predicted NAD/FAD-binding protein
MNRLQNLNAATPLFVTLNPSIEPAPALTLREFIYDHPQFDAAALTAQGQLPALQGGRRSWFCGSYCGYGFHEDALESGLRVATALGAPPPWAREFPADEAVVAGIGSTAVAAAE